MVVGKEPVASEADCYTRAAAVKDIEADWVAAADSTAVKLDNCIEGLAEGEADTAAADCSHSRRRCSD